MERYNYYDAVKDDVVKAICEDTELEPYEDENRDNYRERLEDALWASEVTGNGDYAYYYSDEEDAITAVMWNLELCSEAYCEFDREQDAVSFMNNICEADVTIRCYVLSSAIDAAIDELGFFNEEED